MEATRDGQSLRHRNQERVIATLKAHPFLTRRALAREAGISYPTVSKILADLVAAKVVIERQDRGFGLGRPPKVYRLAADTRVVLGLSIGPAKSELVASGCDGRILEASTRTFRTPRRFSTLTRTIKDHMDRMVLEGGQEIIGVGVSVPGLIDRQSRRVVQSPNLPSLDGRSLGVEMEQALEIPVAVVQCMHGLFLAERMYGEARHYDDFVLLNYVGGLGIAACSEGRFLSGAHGLAGELGHITVDVNGPRCGCGNRGCLETFATDQVVARAVSQRLGVELDFDGVCRRDQEERLEIDDVLDRATDYLAIAVAATINIFDPKVVFLHGRFLQMRRRLFDRLEAQVRRRALSLSLERCRLVSATERTKTSERIGAVAAIVHHLTALQRGGSSE